ncbi:MAG: 2-oxo acid dehydrogenase subunit E2 [Gammaproteobacteria bacterium]|nr:2-oxo acid dehydrogenase subunit E2 [Gammaproteobacteria bacterium]MBU1831649.1 2-oxo acid dehydrogenase subunit E2 [Gammaproteobacteria bacterium]
MNDHFAALPSLPSIDYSQYGEVSLKSLSANQVIGGKFLSRNALLIPHVCHHDCVDISTLDEKRREWNSVFPEQKVTMLPLLIKALVATLKVYPIFNSSLDDSGKNVILKHYYNIGIAIDTEKGLVVGVVRQCDSSSIVDISEEISRLSIKARSRGLTMEEMSGGGITLSSLGDLGGTGFTPIINAPEVAIIGVSRAEYKQCFSADKQASIRYMLPLSLSYDHRVINGADAGRFLAEFQRQLNAESLFAQITKS